MKGVIYAATAAAAILFVGALSLFASFMGGVTWRAFERPPERLGRVPAVWAPDEPVVLTMTAADVDSVPEALEARPRAAAPAPEPEPQTALGDVEPRAPKAAAKKAQARKPTLFQKVGLGGGRRGLQLGSGPSFDGAGGGSGAFGGGAAGAAEGESDEAPSHTGPAAAAPARARTLRALTPTRGSVGTLPAAPPEEEPAGDDDGE